VKMLNGIGFVSAGADSGEHKERRKWDEIVSIVDPDESAWNKQDTQFL